VFVVTDGGVEYITSVHPSNEMMWYIPHHSVRGKAGALTVTECYGSQSHVPQFCKKRILFPTEIQSDLVSGIIHFTI